MPTKWRIYGAWKDTGQDVELVIECPTATGAESMANDRGVMVQSCEPVLPVSMPNTPYIAPAPSPQMLPQSMYPPCPRCGSNQVGRVRGLQGFGEVMVFIVLFFCVMIPGVIYYIYMESIPYCAGCGRRVAK